jgi:hypothetical protein
LKKLKIFEKFEFFWIKKKIIYFLKLKFSFFFIEIEIYYFLCFTRKHLR